jgi:hypothetical protein
MKMVDGMVEERMLESLLCMHQSGQDQPIQRDTISLVTFIDQAYISAAYTFDYNSRNDLQSLHMVQEMTELSGALTIEW